MEFLVKATRIWNTPVFTVYGPDVRFARVYGATRIKGDPLWYFPAFYPVFRLVIKDMRALKLPVKFSEAATKLIAVLEYMGKRLQDKELPSDFKFKTQPFAHQLDGLVHSIYNYRSALFYACGLGKTKIVIDWQRAIQCTPLILCPKVVLRVWATEAKRHGIEQEYRIIDAASKKGKLKQLADTSTYSGIVVSYDTARLYYELLGTLPYNAIVADESHYIKNFRSARTKTATELAGKTSRRIIMSGTPSLGDPRDIYPQFRFLAPCFMSENFWHFKNKFCVTSAYNKHVVTGFKNLDVLQKRTALVALERKKEDCLDLPPRTIIDELVPLAPKQQRAYNTLVMSKEYQEFFNQILDEQGIFSDEGSVDIPNAAVLVNKLLQVASGFIYKKIEDDTCDGCEHMRSCVVKGTQPHTKACRVDQTPAPKLTEFTKDNAKLAALVAKITEILIEPTHKIIIWAQFTAELDLIEQALNTHWDSLQHDHKGEGHAFFHIRVDGSTKNIAKDAETFNDNANCRVYLGQVSTGVGITLNAAAYMLYYSLPWRLDAYGQSLDRNHRVGQTEKTFVYRFLGRGTVDESVARALNARMDVADVLSAVLLCARCDRQSTCPVGTEPFEDECKYSRKVTRPVTKVRRVS